MAFLGPTVSGRLSGLPNSNLHAIPKTGRSLGFFTHWLWRLAAFVAACLFCLALSGKVMAGEPAVRSGVHDGYARIVFAWSEPTDYDASLNDTTLTLHFSRPLAISFEETLAQLQGYLAGAEIDADRQGVTFNLTRPFALRTFPEALLIVVDLIDPMGSEGTAVAQALPDAPPPGGERLSVRVGSHEGFDRIVFDWGREVSYEVVREGLRVIVAFGEEAALDLEDLRAKLPEDIRAEQVDLANGGLRVAFAVPAGTTLRHFRERTFVVLDLLEAPPPDAGAIVEAAHEPDVEDLAAAPAEDAAAPSPTRESEPSGAALETSDDAAKSPGRPSPDVMAVPSPLDLLADLRISGVEPSQEENAAPADQPEDAAPTSRSEAPTPAGPPTDRLEEGPHSLAASRQSAAPDALPVILVPQEDGLVLRFAWSEPTAAAIFQRNGALWVVFDRPAPVDLPPIGLSVTKTRGLLSGRVLDEIAHATVLRFDLDPEFHATARREGNMWLVELSRAASGPARALVIRVEPDAAAGPRVFLAEASLGPVLRMADPDSGEELIVVPLRGSGHGIDPGRRYAEFELLDTSQGVVIQPLTEDILVQGVQDGIQVTSREGLRLSSLGDDGGPVEAPSDAFRDESLFRFGPWRRLDDADYAELLHPFLRAVSVATDANRTEARLNLARFYLANGQAAYALGVLSAIEREDPDAVEGMRFAALRGATMVLLGRFEEAAADLGNSRLDSDPDIMLWRGVAAAGMRDWEIAAPLFQEADLAFLHLLPEWRAPFGVHAARAAIETGDEIRTHFRLDQIVKEDPAAETRAEVAYLRGRAYAFVGNYDAALAMWEVASQGIFSRPATEATLARIYLLLELDQMTPPEAVAELEELRFAWRGDSVEQDLLYRLGRIYSQEGDYLNGLLALRKAVDYFPDEPRSAEIASEMRELFDRFLLEARASELDPLEEEEMRELFKRFLLEEQANGLGEVGEQKMSELFNRIFLEEQWKGESLLETTSVYYEFRELAPTGEEGDLMLGDLAGHLVDFDLLERAGTLLEFQIEHRLSGRQKAEEGLRLARIRLLDQKPDAALHALEISALDGQELPGDLAAARTHLQARAELLLGNADTALALVAGDKSDEATKLRADIHWSHQDWSAVAAELSRLNPATARLAPVPSLDDEESHYLVMQAAAFALTRDEESLVELKRRYGPAMAEGPLSEAFLLITADSGKGPQPFHEYARMTADVSAIEAFLEN
ncbi:MAG: tetratricopeptide repeat protein [Proteobacteria bacterium]|nr:tetratricopeptide repeat protein [Pseudomonadota bacterium]